MSCHPSVHCKKMKCVGTLLCAKHTSFYCALSVYLLSLNKNLCKIGYVRMINNQKFSEKYDPNYYNNTKHRVLLNLVLTRRPCVVVPKQRHYYKAQPRVSY